MHDAHQLPPI
jgi:hypothetical protein